MVSPYLQKRRAGILLHPTSLPSGELDSDVERWMQLMADTGFSVWQVLPLGEPHDGLSPYQCTSAFAFNPLLLSDIPDIEESEKGYHDFCLKQQYWLDDYALFKVLKQHFEDKPWVEWPERWKKRDSTTLQKSFEEHADDITALKWQQYQLHVRWHEIRNKASEMDILLFGDMPIFVAHDSADVWAHPEWFVLDADGHMTVVTGVPPDYFSETGQRWGNPHYHWENMREDGFSWWRSRISHHLELFDLVRIDHFRGMVSAWVIDASCETAVDGHWEDTPGDELLSLFAASIEECGGQLPFVAEDLGIITPEVTALRKKYHLPGMSILQFGFDAFEDNPHKPQNITEDTIVYTGTHDNDTTKGWFNSLDDDTKNHVLGTLNLPVVDEYMADNAIIGGAVENDEDIDRLSCWYDNIDIADIVVERMIDNAMHSNAIICIIPLQDCLHLGSDARMNTPGTIDGNWQWGFKWSQIEFGHDSARINKMRLRNEHTQRFIEPDS